MIPEIRCPRCAGPMTLRIARFGPNAGNEFWGCSNYPKCKGLVNRDGSIPDGSATKVAAKRAPRPKGTLAPSQKFAPSRQTSGTAAGKKVSVRRGDLIVSKANRLGPGKAVGRDGENFILEYFDTPEQRPEERTRLSVPPVGLSRFILKPETRVFWVAEGKWRSGRVIETSPHGDIYVRARNWDGHVREEFLFVRWHRPLTNPVGFAAGGLLESPLLADMRRPFLRSVLRQRAAACGMKGALSSAIELHDHQLEAGWRVLQDPVQRYLLADEVGLGKTIEAGIVMRQLLLDDPELSVQLILPPFLIGQWQQELANKFFIQDFRKADVRFARNDEPSTWAPADLVVVDEAHNLAALSDSDQPDLAMRFAKLAQIANESPRLLMLSATPALNNEPVFLEMLKLLDPAVYGTVSVDDLRNRLAARVGLGRIFLGLQPNLPSSLVRTRLAELRRELPDDPDVHRLLDIAALALETPDRDALTAAIGSIRTHVAEIYRVHRRMLRTRRTSALENTYRVTGRSAPESLALDGGLLAETTQLLESWRQEALAAHENDPISLRSTAGALAEAVSLSFDPESLADWARSRTAATPGERTALNRIADNLAFTRRQNAVAKPIADSLSYLLRANELVVVFCPTSALATELAAEVRKFVAYNAVLEHRSTDSPEHIESVIGRFETARDTAVLIADRSAEEGRNFQFAHVMVHVGVPSDANRVEQRIGRCDRWQMNDGSWRTRSLIVTESGPSETFASAWIRVLGEGFGVFDSSVASLQFAVEAATESAWLRFLSEGLEATDGIIESVRVSLAEEVDRIREQDALDSIEANGGRRSIYRQLTEFESDEGQFAEITHALLAANDAGGNLRFRTIGDPVHGVGGYDAFTRLPGKQSADPSRLAGATGTRFSSHPRSEGHLPTRRGDHAHRDTPVPIRRPVHRSSLRLLMARRPWTGIRHVALATRLGARRAVRIPV